MGAQRRGRRSGAGRGAGNVFHANRLTTERSRTTGHSQHSVPSAPQAPKIKVAARYGVRSTLKENTMRFMMIMFPKIYETAKPGWVPNFKDMELMGKYNEELGKAGVLLALDGLTPPSTMSARVTFKGGKSKVTDGPFTEAKEVVGGYWIIQVKSREEALEWASRIPGQDNEMVEVRRMFDLTDFDPETQKEIQKKFGDAVAAEMRQ